MHPDEDAARIALGTEPEPFEATPTTFRRVIGALSIAIGIIGFVLVVALLLGEG